MVPPGTPKFHSRPTTLTNIGDCRAFVYLNSRGRPAARGSKNFGKRPAGGSGARVFNSWPPCGTSTWRWKSEFGGVWPRPMIQVEQLRAWKDRPSDRMIFIRLPPCPFCSSFVFGLFRRFCWENCGRDENITNEQYKDRQPLRGSLTVSAVSLQKSKEEKQTFRLFVGRAKRE